MVGIAAPPGGGGYWLAGANGQVLRFGDAPLFGSMAGKHLDQAVVGIAATPERAGYWLASADGGVFNFGTARFYGSAAGTDLDSPVVGIAATPDGRGYWLVSANGGVLRFGDAVLFGSMAAKHLNASVVGIAATPDGRGYWLASADGGVFNFGDATFYGSAAGTNPHEAVVGIVACPGAHGYWLAGANGDIYNFGAAGAEGRGGTMALNQPIVAIAAMTVKPRATTTTTTAVPTTTTTTSVPPVSAALAPPPPPLPAPAITSVTPGAGATEGGNTVVITGTGFTGATAVTVGGAAATSSAVVSDTQVDAVTPPGTLGTVDVVVTAPGGTATGSGAFSYVPAPDLTSVSPTSGTTAGGDSVVLTGSGFTGATSVVIDASQASFTVVSDTEIDLTTPPDGVGPEDLIITGPGGTGGGTFAYAPVPVITSFSPTSGPVAGGTTVTLTGTGFSGAGPGYTGTEMVAESLMDTEGFSVASFIVVSDTEVQLVTGPLPDGASPGELFGLETPGGLAISPDMFTYVADPVVSSVAPGSGTTAGGTTVVITGSGFTGATAVTFGGTTATFTVESDTTIDTTTPAGSPGTVDVDVTTPDGTGDGTAAFIYEELGPIITSFTPTSGPADGGTTVTIYGSGFTGAFEVDFGEEPFPTFFTVVSDTEITVVTPPLWARPQPHPGVHPRRSGLQSHRLFIRGWLGVEARSGARPGHDGAFMTAPPVSRGRRPVPGNNWAYR